MQRFLYHMEIGMILTQVKDAYLNPNKISVR